MHHHYQLAGLGFRSPLVLPELDARTAGEAVDVHIDEREGAVPDSGRAPPGGMTWSSDRERCLLDVARIARFSVCQGQRIAFQRSDTDGDAAADDRLLRLFLLGSVLGALWHQRGRLPLHAGAVDVDGRAWAFAGPSGAGKSSLVVAMAASGAGYLCDDVCVLDVLDDGHAHAWPGLARLRVSPEICALLALGDCPPPDPFGKHALFPPWPRPAGARPLAGIVILETDPAAAQPVMDRLEAPAALTALLTHTYRTEYLPMEHRARHFGHCAALVRAVPVYRLRRPWGTRRLPGDAQRLLALLATLNT
ncbi:hypothetical protein [Immundisolibacter sp.]|uniref:hypothetical protein n=1 Tax=Immundisolibacter sp. TaxID=1934948 RepID=UPI0035650ABC